MAVNLQAQLDITQALLDADGVLKDDARIVCVSSQSGIAGNRGQTNYAASKAGVIGMVRAWAPEFAEARRDDQRRRAGLHRHRDDGEDAARHPRGRLAAQLAAAGRAAGRRRRDDRLAVAARAAPASTARPCGSAASRCWGPDGRRPCSTRPRTSASSTRRPPSRRGAGAATCPTTGCARNGVTVDPAHLAAYDAGVPAAAERRPAGDLPAHAHVPAADGADERPLVPAGAARAWCTCATGSRCSGRSAPTRRWTSRCGRRTSPRTAAARRSTCAPRPRSAARRSGGRRRPTWPAARRRRTAPRRPTSRSPSATWSGSAATWRIPDDAGRRYAKVSGDVNPIHLSGLTAKAFGFKRAIAHGMWVKARVLGALSGRLPDALSRRRQLPQAAVPARRR